MVVIEMTARNESVSQNFEYDADSVSVLDIVSRQRVNYYRALLQQGEEIHINHNLLKSAPAIHVRIYRPCSLI